MLTSIVWPNRFEFVESELDRCGTTEDLHDDGCNLALDGKNDAGTTSKRSGQNAGLVTVVKGHRDDLSLPALNQDVAAYC